MTLRPGPIGNRTVYRWLRRARPYRGSDVYLAVTWTGDLPESVADALDALDLPCKTLDESPGLWEGRTTCWQGRASPRQHAHAPGERHSRWFTDDHDRARGLLYARQLGRLLRAAHRVGVALTVRSIP